MPDLNPKPLVCTFYQLTKATEALHQGDKGMIADLHDIWLKGAPTPDSRILLMKHYDPRKVQTGNLEKRIVLPTLLANWIMQTSAKRGFPYTYKQSLNMALGQEDYNLTGEQL